MRFRRSIGADLADRIRTQWSVRFDSPAEGKPRLLFYHVSGLGHGGTEKTLQALARHVDKSRYEVFFMYSAKPRPGLGYGQGALDSRRDYIAGRGVNLIPFDYNLIEDRGTYIVRGMSPHILDVLSDFGISVLITAGPGYKEFPLTVVRKTPIVFLNVFGFGHDQANIATNAVLSNTLAQSVSEKIRDKSKVRVMYTLTDGPPPDYELMGRELRKELGLPPDAVVFGRIGRADDGIYDPIGIQAFERVVPEFPAAHYLIKSPPSALVKYVQERAIPNVHFLPPSGDERQVWAFHAACDIFAHFRKDGETCGLCIGEAMLCGKPILTHVSEQWNCHLEYLTPDCAKVAPKDDVEAYAGNMRALLQDNGGRLRKTMGECGRMKARNLFLAAENIRRFEGWIDEILAKRTPA